jgi:hypothetical protein
MAMSRNALLRAARNSPARFIQVAAALIPQHFKFEHEHSIAGLSTEELRERLNEARARLLEAGVVIDAERYPQRSANLKMVYCEDKLNLVQRYAPHLLAGIGRPPR